MDQFEYMENNRRKKEAESNKCRANCNCKKQLCDKKKEHFDEFVHVITAEYIVLDDFG